MLSSSKHSLKIRWQLRYIPFYSADLENQMEYIYWKKECRLKANEILLHHGSLFPIVIPLFLHLGKEDDSNNFINSVALCFLYNARTEIQNFQ